MTEVLGHEWFCEQTGTEIKTLAGALAKAADISAGVPSCPGWSIADLAMHIGTVHRWAESIVTSRASARPAFPEVESAWQSAGEWARWLESGAPPLLAALRSAGPGTPVWTWGPGRTSGWWARRMLHETTVHRADAELSLGVGDPVIDPVVAADGIDEFLFNLPSARRPYHHLTELPTGASLHLHATDGGGEWMIWFTDSGIAWQRGHEKATAAVRGPVTSLLLFTYGRRPAADPRLAVFGDESLPPLWQEKTVL